MASGTARTLGLVCVVGGSACVHGPSVERVYGGTLVEGHYVEASAYAASLRRTLSESARAAERADVQVGRRDAEARAAEELAGMGGLGAAWAMAGAAIDASDEPLSEDRGLASRLAVDQAIARADLSIVTERATRARVSLEETAARALLAGRRELARSIARLESQADPGALGARLVLAAAGGSDAMGMFPPYAQTRSVSAAEWVACGQVLQHMASHWVARSALMGLAHSPILGGDDRVVRVAVDLAARGVIGVEALPATGRIELAVIRDGRSSDGGEEASFDRSALDARHRYLSLAREAPLDAGTRELGDRLRDVAGRDPIVAAARALVDLAGSPATSTNVEPPKARALLDLNPADPVVASVALRVATKTGESAVAEVARKVLALSEKAAP
jgi:hypothetical protein